MGGVWEMDRLATVRVPAPENGKTDLSSREPTTLVQTFTTTVAKAANDRALSIKKDGKWVTHTWQQYFDASRQFARALIRIGVQPHEAVNVLGDNCPEWLFTYMGTILAGAVIAGIYGTSSAKACQYISAHCEAKVVVVSDKEQLIEYLSMLGQLPKLKALVVWSEVDIPQDAKYSVPVYSFSKFLQLGDEVEESVLDERMAAQQPGHCCSLVYTSGTTGPPKAVMISHDNLTWMMAAAWNAHPEASSSKRSVSFLPLSHSAAQLLDIHVPLTIGSEVYFAGLDALRGGLLATLQEVRPHYFCGVPRVWEKMMDALKIKFNATDELQKSMLGWAMEQAGLDECTLFLTGAAPTSLEVMRFFGSLNIQLYELYGQTELTGPLTFSMSGKWKLGSVGPPLEGTQTRIDPNTGEVQYTGRHVFMGYLHDEEATKKTVDDDGWLYSGDIGELDQDGYLSITGRLKGLIITSGGENIPPVLIEREIKTELPALSNVMVIGEKRNYLTFLCSLRVEPDAVTGAPTDTLDKVALGVAKDIGSAVATVSEAQACEKFHKYISDGMARANARTASRAQHVQKFVILPRDFSIDGNELTPTMKVKRAVVEKMYIREIEKMYTSVVR
ncbi:Long-chain-fatty-acid--CoA ligase ACSBG2 [Phytophthora cinnamomi]|uniref:Long-chain-fatty-acid--CoA ligase ACSBG2 n=1 Tax=Phytophthora cinnamomi TaxID=4785 RepID=UPI003559A483|nr:Long-chain-fatty-acid--CoA ligase ACSBG2 [Phytophthora cinnamomi]